MSSEIPMVSMQRSGMNANPCQLGNQDNPSAITLVRKTGNAAANALNGVSNPPAPSIELHAKNDADAPITLTPHNPKGQFSEAVIIKANELFADAKKARTREALRAFGKMVIVGLLVGIAVGAFFGLPGMIIGAIAGLCFAAMSMGVGYFCVHKIANDRKLSKQDFNQVCQTEYAKLVNQKKHAAVPLFEEHFKRGLFKRGLSEDSFEKAVMEIYNVNPQFARELEERIIAEQERLLDEYPWITPGTAEMEEMQTNPDRLEFKQMCEAIEDPSSGYEAYVSYTLNQYKKIPSLALLTKFKGMKKKEIVRELIGSDFYHRFKNVNTQAEAIYDLRLYRQFKKQQANDKSLEDLKLPKEKATKDVQSKDVPVATAAQEMLRTLATQKQDLIAAKYTIAKEERALFKHYGMTPTSPPPPSPSVSQPTRSKWGRFKKAFRKKRQQRREAERVGSGSAAHEQELQSLPPLRPRTPPVQNTPPIQNVE